MATEDLGIFKQLSTRDSDRIFALSLLGFTIFHLVIILTSPLDLASDEAMYWGYSKHLAWSYYAKGPGMGVATWIATYLFGDTVLAIRSIALFCFTSFSAIFYYFVRYLHSARTALATFIFIRVTILFVYTGFITTTDPLVILFWILSLIFAYLAIAKDSPKFWCVALPLVGVAILAKYTAAILLFGYGSVLIFHRRLLKHLIHPAFWVGVVLFAITISPIIIWNYQHGWVNFQHNLGHTVGRVDHAPFKHLPSLVAGQIGVIGPFFFILLFLAMVNGIKSWWKKGDPVLGLWISVTLPLLTVCIIVSISRSCYVNWPLPAYIGGVLLVIHEFNNLKKKTWFKKAIITNAVISLFVQVVWFLPTILPNSVPLPSPIRKMTNWNLLGKRVEKFIVDNRVNAQEPFILTTEYMVAASLRFEVSKEIIIRLGSYNGRRPAEQDYWQTWRELIGRSALVIQKRESDAIEELVPRWFSECREITLSELPPSNRLPRDFQFLVCTNFTGELPKISGSW